MWTTPAPPSTALVAASIWSGTGEVKTSPGHAASSIPRPTKPPCSGSWADPPPLIRAPLTCPGASGRGLVPGPAAAGQGDLALPRRVGAHEDLRLGVVAQQVAVGRGEPREGL